LELSNPPTLEESRVEIFSVLPFFENCLEHQYVQKIDLRKQVVMFSLSLYDQNYLPRKQVLEYQEFTTVLLSSIATAVEGQFSQKATSISEELETILNFCKNHFEDIKSEYRLLKILTKMNLYREPQAVSIDKKIQKKNVARNPYIGRSIS